MKKNILIKSIILTFLLSLFVSIFCLVSFADSSNGVLVVGDKLVFNESLSSDFIPSSHQDLEFFIIDQSGNHVSFSGIHFDYRGYLVLTYESFEGNILVYDNSGWVNDIYRTIYINGNYVFEGNLKAFIDINTNSSVPIYDSLFNLFSNTFFGSRELDPIEKLSITLLCLVLCVAILCIPIVICYLILIGLSRIGVRYL